ncbi:MAG TPA: GPR1/FUN34/YaaH family transporter [Solirubrobacteraceae bacterium]|nr:GPR1/FUN34/YaaH family transporter [Solirubrobacteraceae bacterium]
MSITPDMPVRSRADDDPETASTRAARIVLRPIATPFPLGFAALATASLVIAGSELGWFSPTDRPIVAVLLIGFSFPLQLLSSIFGFLSRDTVAATGFAVQGATWLVVGLGLLMGRPGHVDHVIGVLLLASSAWVAFCAFGSSLGKLVPAAVMAAVSVRFLLTGLYQLSASRGLEHAAGIVGLLVVALAAYGSLALEVENLERRTVLPLLRRHKGAEALEGDFSTQTHRLIREPGAREQL